jgi:UDP-N-acetylmuramate dehydrogenase
VQTLSDLTTLGLGGPPRRLVDTDSDEALVAAVREADAAGEPLLVLGGGSNLVVADEGFPGTVVRVGIRGVERDGERITVRAGESWDAVVERTVGDGLAGFECLSGIPGLTGATPIQNVGAYGQDVSDTIVSVRAYDRTTGETRDMTPAECEFGYRTSAFKRTPGRWVVLAVSYALHAQPDSMPIQYAELARELGVEIGGTAPLRQVRTTVLRIRAGKGMVIDPADPDSRSAGSFFTNPILEAEEFERLEQRAGERAPAFPEPDGRVKTSAAWLVERAGFGRGYGLPGPVAVSSKHSLALTNRGGGTTDELLALAHEIAAGVQARFGVELVPEPMIVGREWAPAGKAARPA